VKERFEKKIVGLHSIEVNWPHVFVIMQTLKLKKSCILLPLILWLHATTSFATIFTTMNYLWDFYNYLMTTL